MSYSQNGEDKIILDYFQGFVGTVLDIGANDGETFSNSLLLIQHGWKAVLVEPSPTCVAKLKSLHKSNRGVLIAGIAIDDVTDRMTLYESGTLLKKGDTALVSTLIEHERQRWEPLNIKWNTIQVDVFSWPDFLKRYPGPYDFISIDAEGVDWKILKQINLSEVRCLCVEHNGVEIEKYIQYCEGFGMKELHRNGENLIMVK